MFLNTVLVSLLLVYQLAVLTANAAPMDPQKNDIGEHRETRNVYIPRDGDFEETDSTDVDTDQFSQDDAMLSDDSPVAADTDMNTTDTDNNSAGSGDESSESPDKPYAMAYYPDWVELDPEDVDFTLFDWIDFAFALPTSDFGLNWDHDYAPTLLKKIVKVAHKGNTKVKLSIGGWTDSKYFSAAVEKSTTRSAFVKHISKLYDTMGVDGIDIDWEYPGQEGAGNKFSSDDTDNYLLFLKDLRSTLPTNAKITAAVTPEPWVDKTGSPATDLSAFADVLDWVLIMNYDVNVPPQKIPGPNAPLRDACGTAKRPEDNAEGGLEAWKAAGFPAKKIALGIAAYGYVHDSDATKLVMRRRNLADDATRADVGTDTGDTSTSGASSEGILLKPDADEGGQIQFRSIIEQGALTSSFKGAGGFTRHWDKCSDTPFLVSSSGTPQMVSYDDPQSIRLKGKFAAAHSMRGLGMWDMHGDTKDWALMKAARAGLGLSGTETET